MDRTSIIVIAICMVLLGLWSFVVMPKLTPPPAPRPAATNSPVVPSASSSQGTTPPPPPSLAEAPMTAPKPVANTNAPEELLVLTNENARYTFTSYGGGLRLVELTRYPETVLARKQKAPQTHRVATL